MTGVTQDFDGLQKIIQHTMAVAQHINNYYFTIWSQHPIHLKHGLTDMVPMMGGITANSHYRKSFNT